MAGKKPAKEKTFKVKLCPKCKSDEITVVIGGQMGMWECRGCGFRGPSFPEKEMTEEEYFDYLDKKDIEMPELGEPKTVEEKKSHKEMLKEKMEAGEKI
jgi:Zn ribbon nucleic-acid-binding protein